MNSPIKKWLIALGYVLFIYLTLGSVRAPLLYLRSHGILRLSLAFLYLIFCSFIVGVIWKKTPREYWRYGLLLIVAFVYAVLARWVKTPEEQIHFFQYGFVGILFFRAIQQHSQNSSVNFLTALLLAGLAGWWDEILQGKTPQRHYDVNDIYLNIISSFLGLLVYKIISKSSCLKIKTAPIAS